MKGAKATAAIFWMTSAIVPIVSYVFNRPEYVSSPYGRLWPGPRRRWHRLRTEIESGINFQPAVAQSLAIRAVDRSLAAIFSTPLHLDR
jgi:hypothetical protein